METGGLVQTLYLGDSIETNKYNLLLRGTRRGIDLLETRVISIRNALTAQIMPNGYLEL